MGNHLSLPPNHPNLHREKENEIASLIKINSKGKPVTQVKGPRLDNPNRKESVLLTLGEV